MSSVPNIILVIILIIAAVAFAATVQFARAEYPSAQEECPAVSVQDGKNQCKMVMPVYLPPEPERYSEVSTDGNVTTAYAVEG